MAIVIALTVVVSATTTFMTVRQSAKRGLMQTNIDPDNPMAQSQKFMQYIVPFFSLTGLYWQYGLVLYWVTTNLWTLGQQYFMFRNWDDRGCRRRGRGSRDHRRLGADRAEPGPPASSGSGSSRQASARPGSNAKAASGAKPPSGAKSAASGARTGTATGARNGTASGARTGTASSRSAAQGSAPARAKGGAAPASGRTGTASRPATTTPRPATGQNGSEKRGLLRFGRGKAEPEPQDDVPTAKVVRQQPVRQARSKRSGKR